jgi:hypothetical protein
VVHQQRDDGRLQRTASLAAGCHRSTA